MIQVIGNLVNPLGEEVQNARIRVEALNTVVSIDGLIGEVVTGSAGEYSFNMVNGQHAVEVNFDEEYHYVVKVEVTEATTTPITLTDLLTNYAI